MITRFGRKKGVRDENQKKTYAINHERLKKLLEEAITGTTREKLYVKTGLSRRIITKHIRHFGGDIRRKNRRLFWAPNYERYQELRETIETISRILMKVGLDSKLYLENYALALFPHSSHVYFFSPNDKELIQMISHRSKYVGKVMRRRYKVLKKDMAALDDIWTEEGII